MHAIALSDFSRFIADLGFPVFVAVWMLVVTSRLHAQAIEAINALKEEVHLLRKTLEWVRASHPEE